VVWLSAAGGQEWQVSHVVQHQLRRKRRRHKLDKTRFRA
jgi:hypothetical protein